MHYNNLIRLSHLFGTKLLPQATTRILNMNHIRLLEYDDKTAELRIEYSNGQSLLLKDDIPVFFTNVASHSTRRLLSKIQEIQENHVDAPLSKQ